MPPGKRQKLVIQEL